MHWEFKKTFYGNTTGKLDLARIREFLEVGHTLIPYTLIEGYYRSVYWDGEYNDIYAKMQKPWPDFLTLQKPNRKFAMHLSGGFDSSILAKLYDRPDADYFHVRGPETEKAEAMGKVLQGTLHILDVTPDEYIKAADAILPNYTEPECDAAGVLAYIASKKAKELGHDLLVTGDCADTILGGHTWGPHSEKPVDVWKTLEPNILLGIKTLMPFGHPGLKAWAKATLKEEDVDYNKNFLRRFSRELGLPSIVTEQKKIGWGGCWDYTTDPAVAKFMQDTVEKSEFGWLADLKYYKRGYAPFRLFALIKWLEKAYKGTARKREDYEPKSFRSNGYPQSSPFIEIPARDKLIEQIQAIDHLTKNNRFAIFGGGRHGKAVAYFIKDHKLRQPDFIIDDNPQAEEIAGVPVLHTNKTNLSADDVVLLSTFGPTAQMKNRLSELDCKAKVVDPSEMIVVI